MRRPDSASVPTEELLSDGFYTQKEAAQIMRTGRTTIGAMLDRREIVYTKVGGKRVIPKRALDLYLSAQTVRTDRG